MNLLADTDPAEYDKRIKEWHKRQLEAREKGARGSGGDSRVSEDRRDTEQSGDLGLRKSLARERRAARYRHCFVMARYHA